MRVVLDTNILISALWTPHGLEAKTVGLVRRGNISAFVSDALWEEYRDVLFRKKFAKHEEAASQMLAELEPCMSRVHPAKTIKWSTDDDDNRVLECVQEARADYLITGNLRHFPEVWQGARIVNARRFLGAAFPEFEGDMITGL